MDRLTYKTSRDLNKLRAVEIEPIGSPHNLQKRERELDQLASRQRGLRRGIVRGRKRSFWTIEDMLTQNRGSTRYPPLEDKPLGNIYELEMLMQSMNQYAHEGVER